MSLLTYSGITTKVRAMESRLFTEEQFREMAALEDVHSAADYLKQQPAYAGIFSGLDDSMLHRGNIERLLTLSLYRDFASLYRFGSLKQRRFLDLYFMHYEIDIMKRALRHVYSKQPAEMDLSEFREFFESIPRLIWLPFPSQKVWKNFKQSERFYLLRPACRTGGKRKMQQL